MLRMTVLRAQLRVAEIASRTINLNYRQLEFGYPDPSASIAGTAISADVNPSRQGLSE
jgi:hypothetical protein